MPSPPRKRQRRKNTTPPPPSPATRPRPGAKKIVPKPVQPADSSTRATRVLNWLLRKLPAKHREKALDYLVLTRMDRPIGALLLLWPTWWALWLAAGDFPPWKPLIIFTLGVFAMRAAGCAINDYADRAALAALYPFTKRLTHMPQVVLGAAFGWSIPMAFAAVSNSVPPVAWLLFIGNILWSVVYDTEYAMVDREDDLKAGAKSTAIMFGDADLPILGVLMATFLLTMLFVGQRAALGWPYWLGLLVAAGLFAYQHWLIRDRLREACLAAFRHNNWLGLAVWIGIVLALAVK